MKRTSVCVFVLLFALAGFGFAENPVREQPTQEAVETPAADKAVVETGLGENTWLGKLVDQDCKSKHIDHLCPVSPETEHFGLVIDGGIIVPFDEASNEKTKELVAKDGRKGNLDVAVVGGREGGGFKVQSIKVTK